MKIKIGDKTYDSNEVPILLILSQQDKDNIGLMPGESYKYCSYPDDDRFTEEEIREFMGLENIEYAVNSIPEDD